MDTRSRARRVAWSALLVLFAATGRLAAFEDASRFEAYGGYAFLRDLGDDESINLPLGWSGSFTWNLRNSLGVVADVGGNYKTEQGVDLSVHTVLGGVRYSFRGERYSPYVEALAGAVRATASVGAVSVSSWDPAFQAGVGLAYHVTESAALKTGIDFRGISSEGDTYSQIRFVAGLSLGFGGPVGAGYGPQPSYTPSPPRGPSLATGTPTWEIAPGYAFLRDLGDDAESLPLGWSVSLARNFGDSLGVVADVGGNYKSEAGVDFDLHAFMGGARYSFRGERLTPYVEVLAGPIRSGVSALGQSGSQWDFAAQGGAGVAYRIGERWSVRAGVDVRNIFSEGESYRQLRGVAGVSFGIGGAEPLPMPVAPPPRPAAPVPVAPPPPSREPAAPAPPAAPPVAEPVRPPAPASAVQRGQALLRAGRYSEAAVAFRDHLWSHTDKFTIPVGLFCDVGNVSQLVQSAGAESLFLVVTRRRGQTCYALYTGLFDSQWDAQRGLGELPQALRAPGQSVLPVSRLLR